jgi:hypothetical protein
VLLGVLSAGALTEMKRVVGDNATLPCYHKFWQSNGLSLDIEWLLQKPKSKQNVVSLFLPAILLLGLPCFSMFYVCYLFPYLFWSVP